MDDPTGIAIPRPTQPYAGTTSRLTDDCEPARMAVSYTHQTLPTKRIV